jgi:hypothetical protein
MHMPLEGIFTIVAAIVVGAVVLVVLLRNQKRKATWRTAVADAANRLGLQITPLPTYYDMARGKIGDVDVELMIDSESRGDSQVEFMKLEVDHGGEWFTIKAPNTALRRDARPDKPRTPTGDASFDAAIEIYGGTSKLLGALRTMPDFREQLLDLVGRRGVVVHEHRVTLRSPQIASDAATILGYVEPMVALARRLEHPTAQVSAHPLGTDAARRLQLSDLDDEQKALRVREFVDRIASNIGPGQSYVDTNEDAVEWRGTSKGFPLRIKCDSWPSVEMSLKVSHGHSTVDLDCDEDKIPQPGTPPPWDDFESQLVFVGKGVYIQCSRGSEELEAFRCLPAALTKPIIDALPGDGVRYFRIRPTEITVDYHDHLDKMLDPEGQIVRQAQLMGWAAEYLQRIQPAQAKAEAAAMQPVGSMKITCKYCSSLYFLTATSGPSYGCPNCGAAPAAKS